MKEAPGVEKGEDLAARLRQEHDENMARVHDNVVRDAVELRRFDRHLAVVVAGNNADFKAARHRQGPADRAFPVRQLRKRTHHELRRRKTARNVFRHLRTVVRRGKHDHAADLRRLRRAGQSAQGDAGQEPAHAVSHDSDPFFGQAPQEFREFPPMLHIFSSSTFHAGRFIMQAAYP